MIAQRYYELVRGALWAWLAVAGAAAGQTSQTTLDNLGSPMRVAFQCTEEDTREAGLGCTEANPCPVYLELSSAESVLNRVFVAGNLHTADATLYSILLASEDGGKTWTEPQPRLRFTAFEQIQFIDFETGWVAGANVQGVPRDPFFLVTGDGGKTWRQRPVFDESRTGVVERFRFDSKTSGMLWIDTKLRHELYETMTGGDSWALRQSSKAPIAAGRARPPVEAATRIRTDAKAKAYFVEKQQAGKWIPLAAFLVQAGTCRE